MALVNLILCVGLILPGMGLLALLFPDPAADYLRNTGIRLRIGDTVESSRTTMRFVGVGLLTTGVLCLATGVLIAAGPEAAFAVQ